MEYLLGATTAVFGLWALIATVRIIGLKSANTALEGDNAQLVISVREVQREYDDYKERATKRIEVLLEEIEEKEDREHEDIQKIEDPKKRRARRRAFVADVLGSVLLSEEANGAGRADEHGVRDESTTDTADHETDSG